MIIIVGAGPAGLAAAANATGPHIVVECEPETGGLCRSFDLAGCTFDLGGHAFFTRDSDLVDYFAGNVAGGLHAQPRKAFVRSLETWLPYPFQANLFGLPKDVVVECLMGLFEAARAAQTPPATMAAWIDQAFGPGIGRVFMRPYNEKVWAFPLDELRADWVGERVVRPDVEEIVRGALGARSFAQFPNAVVRYPNVGGFANMFAFLRPARDRMARGKVVWIDPAARTLGLDTGQTLSWSAVVSTLPLDELARITTGATAQLRNAAAALDWNSLHLVSFVVEGMAATDMQRVYSAEQDVPFHKLVINSNSSPHLRARPHVAIQAEVSFSRHRSAPADLAERCWEAMRRMGLVDARARIVASDLRTLRQAYPVATVASAGARGTLTEAFARMGVFCAGRFGAWTYVNSDGAFAQGRSAMAAAERFARDERAAG